MELPTYLSQDGVANAEFQRGPFGINLPLFARIHVTPWDAGWFRPLRVEATASPAPPSTRWPLGLGTA